MTTRRNVLIMTGGAALLTACREPLRAPVVVPPDLLLVDTLGGLVALSGTQSHGLGRHATVSPDAASAYTAVPGGGGTTLVRVAPATGARTGLGSLAGRWTPRVVSTDGRSCALTEGPPPGDDGRPAARPHTAVLVVQGDGQRRLRLPGVVEPDAFTSDGSGLFVLEWLPAGAPDRYRVRLLDLATGRLQPLLTRAKTPVPPGAEEQMRGAGRQSLLSPDRQILYTLYTHQADHRHTRDLVAGRPGGVHAFVHVLHLHERWAYCLDLPHPFGEGPAAGHAMAISDDGDRLLVADVASGSLAHADTADLAVRRVSAVPAGPGAAGMSIGRNGTAFVGAGRTVTVVDPAGAVTGQLPLPHELRGIGISRDGARIYTGGSGEVTWLDTGSGRLLGRAAVDGVATVRHVI